MRSINKVILIGNLTRDPEVRQTPNGQSVTTFGIATNREWVTRDNQRHTSSEFHEIVAWSHLAEICGKHLKKGKLVYIEGYLKTRSWDAPEGIKKFKTEIVIQDMIMLEKRAQGDERASGHMESSDDFIPDEENVTHSQEMHSEPAMEEKIMVKEPVEHKPQPVQAAQPLDIDQDLGL